MDERKIRRKRNTMIEDGNNRKQKERAVCYWVKFERNLVTIFCLIHPPAFPQLHKQPEAERILLGPAQFVPLL